MARSRRPVGFEFGEPDVELLCRADELEAAGDSDRAEFVRAFVAAHGPCTLLDELKIRRWLREIAHVGAEHVEAVDRRHRRFVWPDRPRTA